MPKVIRVLTYEADEQTLLKQLSRSLPDGLKEVVGLTIRVETVSSDIELTEDALAIAAQLGGKQ